MLRIAFFVFILVYIAPIAVSAARYYLKNDIADWRSASRSSAGLLPPAAQHADAVVRVFSARTVSWRGIIASHSWIVVKGSGDQAYQRFDYTAWGLPIWVDRFVPDGRWFGSTPELVFAADGPQAERSCRASEPPSPTTDTERSAITGSGQGRTRIRSWLQS